MESLALACLLAIAIVVVVRAVLLPLCGRLAIWRENLYRCNDLVEIGESRGRVVRIGLFHTFLVPMDALPGKISVISNAAVFRNPIAVTIKFPDWDGPWSSRR